MEVGEFVWKLIVKGVFVGFYLECVHYVFFLSMLF